MENQEHTQDEDSGMGTTNMSVNVSRNAVLDRFSMFNILLRNAFQGVSSGVR